MKKQLLKIYFWGGIIYQMIALISLLSLYKSSPLYDYVHTDLVLLGLLITLPINFLSFGLMYADSGMELYVIIIQSVIFLIFLLIYKFLKKRWND